MRRNPVFWRRRGFFRTLTSGERRPERGEKILEGNNNKRQRKRVGLRVERGPSSDELGPCHWGRERDRWGRSPVLLRSPRTPVPPWRAWGRGATWRSLCRPQSARCLSPAGRSSQIPQLHRLHPAHGRRTCNCKIRPPKVPESRPPQRGLPVRCAFTFARPSLSTPDAELILLSLWFRL